MVITIPLPVQSFLGDSHCPIGDLSLLAMKGGAEGEVMDSILVVISSMMIVTSQDSHHTARPHQDIQHGLKYRILIQTPDGASAKTILSD